MKVGIKCEKTKQVLCPTNRKSTVCNSQLEIGIDANQNRSSPRYLKTNVSLLNLGNEKSLALAYHPANHMLGFQVDRII